jgi:hypothetical protein
MEFSEICVRNIDSLLSDLWINELFKNRLLDFTQFKICSPGENLYFLSDDSTYNRIKCYQGEGIVTFNNVAHHISTFDSLEIPKKIRYQVINFTNTPLIFCIVSWKK